MHYNSVHSSHLSGTGSAGIVGGGGSSLCSSSAVSLPAARGVFPLDVGSWIHTTLPQLFRAAAVVVAKNAHAAAPLGVPTLVAFFEPFICCRRIPSRRRMNAASSGAGEATSRKRPTPNKRRKSDGDSVQNVGDGGEDGVEGVFVGNIHQGDGEERRRREVEREMEVAAAAGADAAAECGITGEELVSRMALESIGLLVEGLAGQQVTGFGKGSRRSSRLLFCFDEPDFGCSGCVRGRLRRGTARPICGAPSLPFCLIELCRQMMVCAVCTPYGLGFLFESHRYLQYKA